MDGLYVISRLPKSPSTQCASRWRKKEKVLFKMRKLSVNFALTFFLVREILFSQTHAKCLCKKWFKYLYMFILVLLSHVFLCVYGLCIKIINFFVQVVSETQAKCLCKNASYISTWLFYSKSFVVYESMVCALKLGIFCTGFLCKKGLIIKYQPYQGDLTVWGEFSETID